MEIIDTRDEALINLRRYVTAVFKRKWYIIIFSLVVSLFSVLKALTIEPSYKSTSVLLIESEQVKAISIEDVYGLGFAREEYYQTQFEILKSRSVVSKVIKKLNLNLHPDFLPKKTSLEKLRIKFNFHEDTNREEYSKLTKNITDEKVTGEEIADERMERLIDLFLSNLSVSPLKKTQLVKVSYESRDPKLTSLIANYVAEVYIQENISSKIEMTNSASDWLNSRLHNLRIILIESEGKLQKYRKEKKLVDIRGVLSLVGAQLEQTSEQLILERNKKNQLESILRVIDENSGDNIELLDKIPDISYYSPDIRNVEKYVIEVRLKLSSLKKIYGPKHPVMIAVNSELKTVNLDLENQVNRSISGVEKRLTASKNNIFALKNELNDIRKKYQEVSSKNNEHRKLKRDVETNREMYNSFLSRLKETEMAGDFNAAAARFIDRAYTPTRPEKPKKLIVIVLGFFGSLVLGICIAVGVEMLNFTVRTPYDIESKLRLRALAILPGIKVKKGRPSINQYYFTEGSNIFSECIRRFRTNMLLLQENKASHVVTVTSSVEGEGKTFFALNLAFSLGEVEKTVFIDADMRSSSLYCEFEMPESHPGLSNYIEGGEVLDKCIYHDEKSAIDIMPCGVSPPDPLGLLTTEKFSQLIDVLRKSYTKIVIDAPSVACFSDPLVVSKNSDEVVFVIKSNETKIALAKQCIDDLRGVGAKLMGVVLNEIDKKNQF